MADFDNLFSQLIHEKRSLIFERLETAMKAWMIVEAFRSSGKNILLLTGEGQEESRLFQNLQFFTSCRPIELPSWETLPSEGVAPSADIVGARQKAFHSISQRDGPVIVISSLQSSLQKVLSSKEMDSAILNLEVQEEMLLDMVIEHIQLLGYDRRALATEKGEFAIRGGLIDVFSVTEQRPVRIEFFGDEIESIRYYDPSSQKSQEKITSISIAPCKEFESLEKAENLLTIFDLLGPETVVVLDDLEKLEDRYASLLSQGGGRSKTFMGVEEWLDHVIAAQTIFFSYVPVEALSQVKSLSSGGYGSMHEQTIQFSIFDRECSVDRVNHPFRTLSEFYEEHCLLDSSPSGEQLLDCFVQMQHTCRHTMVVQSLVELEWLKLKLQERGGVIDEQTDVKEGCLSAGFARVDTREILFSTSEVTGRTTVRRDAQRMSSLVTEYDAFQIERGDHVVHFHHGFGKYCGVEKKNDIHGQEQEFFVIEYAERARLFVPLHQAHLITKYVGGKEEVVKLHVLGTNKWKKLKEDTERAILGYASELLKLQANREIQGGIACKKDGMHMQLFEGEFPYTETEDQLSAIADIKKDMCSEKAMDRLICGDVGYGKTEVAMRAAFKAVSDGGKQVAVLAPTTVLASQHYENFSERMNTFGIRVGVLSRFSKPKQNRETLLKAKEGEIDILIGTHKLIQKDVAFKDLGLVIVDEEQRFGVKAKEQLKMLKSTVDFLTLSATPIPRTLYMSLIDIRALSTINTPPHDRLPVKSVVAEYNESLIQSALLRELNRGGQAFFVHNRVETIFEAANKIKKAVPRAKVAVAHGQMSSDELDLVFHAFKRGDVDVLVATSIIENGIDIPNANTILIDRADMFGISDLYQLRGRVGRWNRRAYAYFLVPMQMMLSEIARKRLEAIAQAGGYGGGMKVAMRDLEIRGAGDVLGTEQSGHVTSVGFHLYCKLLKRTIESLQGKSSSWTIDTKIETPFDAKLPEYYVNEVSLRIEFYQRFGDAKSIEEIEGIQEELADRFGALPEPALWLIVCSKVRVIGAAKGYTLIKVDKFSVTVERKTGQKSQTNKVLVSLAKNPEEFEQKIMRVLEGEK